MPHAIQAITASNTPGRAGANLIGLGSAAAVQQY